MFRSPRVKSYLQSASFQGKEDGPLMRLTFYITPITFDLATEVSPRLADRLFRKGTDDKWAPASELGNSRFVLGSLPMQSFEWHPAGEGALDFDAGVLTQGISITGIFALHLFADSPDITLAITCEMPLDSHIVELARKYYRRSVWLTMADMQAELFPQAEPGIVNPNAKCLHCGEPARWIDSEKDFFCQKDVRKAKGEVTLIVPLESPAQAEARVLAEAGIVKNDEPEQPDMSHANRPRGGKAKRREAVH